MTGLSVLVVTVVIVLVANRGDDQRDGQGDVRGGGPAAGAEQGDAGGSTSGASARSTAEAYLAATGNPRRMNELRCPSSQRSEEEAAEAEERVASDGDEVPRFTITAVRDNGDSAEVDVEADSGRSGSMTLEREDGQWCVVDLRM